MRAAYHTILLLCENKEAPKNLLKQNRGKLTEG